MMRLSKSIIVILWPSATGVECPTVRVLINVLKELTEKATSMRFKEVILRIFHFSKIASHWKFSHEE